MVWSQVPGTRQPRGNTLTSYFLPPQAIETLTQRGVVTLVLEEDGTIVENEDFFQMLEDDTCLMALEPGQRWSPSRVRLSLSHPHPDLGW